MHNLEPTNQAFKTGPLELPGLSFVKPLLEGQFAQIQLVKNKNDRHYRRLMTEPDFYEKFKRHGKQNRLTNDELIRLEMKCLAATGQVENLYDIVTEHKDSMVSLYDEIEKKKAAGERFEESEATRLLT